MYYRNGFGYQASETFLPVNVCTASSSGCSGMFLEFCEPSGILFVLFLISVHFIVITSTERNGTDRRLKGGQDSETRHHRMSTEEEGLAEALSDIIWLMLQHCLL